MLLLKNPVVCSKNLETFNKRLVHRRMNLKTTLSKKLNQFESFHDKISKTVVDDHQIEVCIKEITLLSTTIRTLDKTIDIANLAQDMYDEIED